MLTGVISSLQEQASKAEHMPTVYVDWAACLPKDTEKLPNQPIEVRYHAPEEEIALGETHILDFAVTLQSYLSLFGYGFWSLLMWFNASVRMWVVCFACPAMQSL